MCGQRCATLFDRWHNVTSNQPSLKKVLQESLETFVEIDRLRGACYRAANWMQVGITQGRCKLEKSMQGKLPKKYILLYSLVKDFKEQLCS